MGGVETKNYKIKTFGGGTIGGVPSSTGTPPPSPHHNFKLLLAAHLWSKTPGARAPGRAESGASSQALAGARQRRAVSEGSLPPTGRELTAPSGSGGAARGEEITSAGDRAVGGRGVSARGKSGEENGDVTGGRW